MSTQSVDDQLVDEPGGRAEGLVLTGEGLRQLTKRLPESAPEGEITDHLGYDKQRPAGKDGGNSATVNAQSCADRCRTGGDNRARDRDGSFEAKIVKKRQKPLTGVDERGISPAAEGLTTGEAQGHLAEVYGAA
ncbi:transposase [Streptomyces camponoticapitis]|uniref:transposase n=1 Tax=Streptomyces camponoticapitis TaxID=1616125 RepID=UPI001E4AA3EB|nr:transposase [Streptomyces camponoticapitis]